MLLGHIDVRLHTGRLANTLSSDRCSMQRLELPLSAGVPTRGARIEIPPRTAVWQPQRSASARPPFLWVVLLFLFAQCWFLPSPLLSLLSPERCCLFSFNCFQFLFSTHSHHLPIVKASGLSEPGKGADTVIPVAVLVLFPRLSFSMQPPVEEKESCYVVWCWCGA